MTISLLNLGLRPVVFSGIASSGPPFFQTNSCPSSLPHGAVCQIRVYFAPTKAGLFTGGITIRDNIYPGKRVVTLSGTGVSAVSTSLEDSNSANAALITDGHSDAEQGVTPVQRYKLIDLGTLGGPIGYGSVNGDGFRLLSQTGQVSSFADTSTPDSNAPDLCFVGECLVAHAYRWKNGIMTDLGALDNNLSSAAGSINARGWSTGQSQTDVADPTFGIPEFRATLWTRDQIINLGTLDGGTESLGVYLNNSGQVIGFSDNGIPDPFALFPTGTQTRTFLWENGAMQDIGTLGGPDAVPGASCDNQRNSFIPGASFTSFVPNDDTGIPTLHPFLWTKGQMVDLGSLGGTLGTGQCANNRGDVIGASSLPGNLTSHAFLWRHGVMTDLGTLGGDNSEAIWINNAGDIAGSADLPGVNLHDAVVWRDGKILDLGTIGSDACSRGRGINSRGQVVGGSSDCANFLHAFVWNGSGPMLDLNTLIAPGSGVQLTNAININDRGEILAKSDPVGVTPIDDEDLGHLVLLVPCGAGDDDAQCKAPPAESDASQVLTMKTRNARAVEPTHPRTAKEMVATWRAKLTNQYRFPVMQPK